MLSGQGVESDFQIINLDFGGALLRDVRLGDEANPDARIARVEVGFGWRGLAPYLRAIRVVDPHLNLRMDEAGRVSAGDLDHLGGGGGGADRRLELPALALSIEGGQASLDAPFGALTATFAGAGTLGHDFAGSAQIASTTLPGETYALEDGRAELSLVSQSNAIAFRLTGHASRVVWNGARFDGMELAATGRAPLDLSQAALEAEFDLAALEGFGLSARGLTIDATAEGVARADALAPARWSGTISALAARFAQGEAALSALRFETRMQGEAQGGEGAFVLNASRLQGFSLASATPSVNGSLRFNLSGTEALRADATLALTRARLDENTQATMRTALPDIQGMPFGPQMAQAERAFDVAMDRFDLNAPVHFEIEGSASRLWVDAPISARGANGVRISAAPLRDDGPALTLRWPGTNLHAAMAIDIEGGGAPDATLLLDAADWAPDAPLEADGSLTITQWNAQGATLTASEIDLSLVQPPTGEGTLTLTGPVRMSGPLGDGSVRDMEIGLDFDVKWNEGWRVVARRDCVPVRVAGLATAGLAFSDGNFSVCARNGALVAADARNNLTGGFIIEDLRLNGRMAGPEGQPARLRSSGVRGTIGGALDAMLIQVNAAAPTLAIDMAEDRTLTVAGESVTADARIGGGTWRVDGVFNAGTLNDPTLPGEVSAIGGRWSAEPIDQHAVIRVSTAEARVNARPAPEDAEDQRPAFQPMRLADVDAVLDQGVLRADGEIILEEGARRLASFTAEHNVSDGIGVADIVANTLTFGPDLQPYEITEFARGVVANVRGAANGTAQVRWNKEEVTATGTVRPLGLSLAMATIPVIENVGGEINFDDLFLLTTPPEQRITVGVLNPGVAVRNGVIHFQLLGEQRVAIQSARFDFAAGELGVAPTTLTLGAEETRFSLTLRNVDVAALLTQLDFKDIEATGFVEGSLPLLLTPRTAYVENGVLRAAPGGGTIAYTGQAGAGATGMAAIAFDALRSFRYDSLELTLNGDISGEVVTAITFRGENTGRNVDLADVAPIPGIGSVQASGVPFAFNVTVTAPFRRLADTAASITNPRLILERDEEVEVQTEDQTGEPDTPSP